MKPDFTGYVTKNDLLCSDGRTIRSGAFKDCDGMRVPLVWNHGHKVPTNVLGHALLENRKDGVYARCYFNNTESARHIKESVMHGDLNGLSIYANNLIEKAGDVLHGMIREVSLVLAGANPGAMIDTVIAHGDNPEYSFDEADRAIIFSGEPIVLYHSDEAEDGLKHSGDAGTEDTKKTSGKESNDDETVEDVYNGMTDKQKAVCEFLVGEAAKESRGDNEKEEEEVKHNAFEGGEETALEHSIDFNDVLKDAKRIGSLKEAFFQHAEMNGVEDPESYLQHDDSRYGIMATPNNVNSLGIEALFPEYHNLNTPPEFISRNMDWVQGVLNGVHHTPFSRIKSMFADITEDDARARGYFKGNYKKEEVFSLLKRTTDPQTIYKKQRLDRDDIIDITDFDVVTWIKLEMRQMLDEEIARAILVGDGRLASSDDKIQQAHVRSIYLDDDFYAVKVPVKVSKNATEEEIAKATIRTMIKSRKEYKGSGSPAFYTTVDSVTDMLLLEDANGRIIYDTEEKLRTALRVSKIVEVEVMENQTRTDSDNVTRPLIGIMVNLVDYNVGADKGGAVATFEDFDIDYNQNKYLIETRLSGALIKPKSALIFELERATN